MGLPELVEDLTRGPGAVEEHETEGRRGRWVVTAWGLGVHGVLLQGGGGERAEESAGREEKGVSQSIFTL